MVRDRLGQLERSHGETVFCLVEALAKKVGVVMLWKGVHDLPVSSLAVVVSPLLVAHCTPTILFASPWVVTSSKLCDTFMFDVFTVGLARPVSRLCGDMPRDGSSAIRFLRVELQGCPQRAYSVTKRPNLIPPCTRVL